MSIDVFSCIANGNSNDLRGCVDSYVQNARQYGKTFKVVVVDSALTAHERNASKEAALLAHRANRVDVEYISTREIETFLTRAARFSWVDSSELRYALLGDLQIGGGYGAACNVAMLASGRSLIASASTRCDVIGSPGGGGRQISRSFRESKTFGALHSDMEGLWFFDSIDSIAGKCPHLWDVDVLDEVDRSLSECGAVSLGTWGDVGVESPGLYALSQQAAALSVSDDTYTANRRNRAVHRAVRAPCAGEVNLRPLAFGYSKAAAPSLPTESRGGIAGQSMFGHLMHRQSIKTMALPYSVKYEPAGPQVFSFDDVSEVPRRVSFTDFLSVMVDSVGPQSDLAGVGRGLVAMASDHSFIAKTAGIWSRYIAESARTRSVDVAMCPALQGDLAIIADAGDRVLETPFRRGMSRQQVTDGFVPFEFRSGPLAADACAIFIRQIVNFGQLLIRWIDLVAAVADLDKNGVRLGAKI